MKAQVFHDPAGRRAKVAGRLAGLLGALIGGVSTVFVLTLLVVPLLPPPPGGRHARGSPRHLFAPREKRLAEKLLSRAESDLLEHIRQERREANVPARPPAPVARVTAAFYAPWLETGLHSLRANAGRLTHLMPEWIHLTADGAGLDFSDFDPEQTPRNVEVLSLARSHGLRVCPIVNNGTLGRFDPVRAHALLSDPARCRAVAADLARFVREQGFAGLNVDLEALDAGDARALPLFLAALRAALEPGLELSVDIEAEPVGLPLSEIARLVDYVVPMVYDAHESSSGAGPIAPIAWSRRVLEGFASKVPPDKVVLGLGAYGYDWKESNPPAESLTFAEALARARDFREGESPSKVVDFDPAALNPTFEYEDDDGKDHEVWFLDAATALSQLRSAPPGLRGTAVWVLGSEDPGLWPVLASRPDGPPPDLSEIRFPYDVEFEGEGEILSVKSYPSTGRRSLTVEPETSLVTDASYEAYPSPYVLLRRGYVPGAVALTFDDGPDPEWTPRVLQVLGRYGVPGTFFVVGDQLERFPRLARQAFAEGHEIGNHSFLHPDLGTTGRTRLGLEINATERAIQASIGRSSLLFRPPYAADAEPSTAEEVRPVVEAARLGYLTVGELVDPQDWRLSSVDPAGRSVPRGAGEIAQAIVSGLRTVRGNVVLLHDGGGDRARTVAALEEAIPRLLAEGRRFVPVSALAGLSRDSVMPPPRGRDRVLAGIDRVVFEATYGLEQLLRYAFVLAIVLGIGRVLFVVPLALISWRRERDQRPVAEGPRVAVLVAAYNERPVIAATVRSLLASEGVRPDVTVVDDGSVDGTSEAVAQEFRGEPRVRLVRQENAGKAAALNRGLAETGAEVVVCIDADTQLHAGAIRELAAPFSDPAVVAVAGNVKVGNRTTLLGRWQALEYVTSQNLDRRAYALVNAVTVVPGAIGAWRRKAVLDVGGYATDTLAEDMDLTWRLRRAGGTVVTAPRAVGFTEAPETASGFLRQRFRWTFGTLQCLFKHRDALFRFGWFGRAALPALWLFQVLFQAIAPLVDLEVLVAVASFAGSLWRRGLLTQDFQPLGAAVETLESAAVLYAALLAAELLGAAVAVALDREDPRLLPWLLLQRILYRQAMYLVVWKALWVAVRGGRQGWGKVARRGTVSVRT